MKHTVVAFIVLLSLASLLGCPNPETPPIVGDSYQGGVVAYIFTSGDSGYVSGQTHGLIAATSDQSAAQAWTSGGSTQTTAIGTTSTSLGTGLANTNAIVAQLGHTDSAAQLCLNYTSGGYSDWYLPSQDELQKLIQNKTIIGGFTSGYYWSSSESDAANAHNYETTTDTPQTDNKSELLRVRAVRTF